jgi:cell division protein FtsL
MSWFKATVGAGVSAVAGLIFVCFLSQAVIVTAWDSSHRILVAWLVCLVWAVLAVVGLSYARRAVVSAPRPFRLVSAAVARDYARLLAAIEGEEGQQ